MNMRPLDPVFKHLLRDLASVNAMEKHVWLLFLHILPDPNQNHTEKSTRTLNYHFFLHWICLYKIVSPVKLLNVITMNNLFPNKSIGERISQGRNTFHIMSRKQLWTCFKYCQVQSQFFFLFDSLGSSQHFFSYVGMGLPRLKQY